MALKVFCVLENIQGTLEDILGVPLEVPVALVGDFQVLIQALVVLEDSSASFQSTCGGPRRALKRFSGA